MNTETAVDSTTERGTVTGPIWAAWPFATAMTVATTMVLLQSVFAGGLIAESVLSEDAHRANGLSLLLVCLLVLVTSFFVRWPGKGPVWPIVSSGVFVVLILVQAVLGFAEVVQVHVPLGVVITIGAVMSTGRAWKLVRR